MCSSTTPAGRTSSRRCSAGSTRWRRRSCRSRYRSRRASSESSRPTSRRCSGSWPRSRRRSRRGTRSSRSCRSRRRMPGSTSPRCSASPTYRAGVVNLLSGRRGELAMALGGHRDLNAILDASGDAALGAELDKPRGRDDQARTPRQRRDLVRPGGRRRAGADRRGDRAEDRLAPGGGVARGYAHGPLS